MWKEGRFSIFPRHLIGKSFFSRDSGNRVDTFSENCGRFSIAMLLEGGISTSTAGLSENARGKASSAAPSSGCFPICGRTVPFAVLASPLCGSVDFLEMRPSVRCIVSCVDPTLYIRKRVFLIHIYSGGRSATVWLGGSIASPFVRCFPSYPC